MLALDTQLPNRRAGALTFPMGALDTQLPSSRDGSSSKITDRAEHLLSGRPRPFHRLATYAALRIFQTRMQVNTGGRLELHSICCRLPTIVPTSAGPSSRLHGLVPILVGVMFPLPMLGLDPTELYMIYGRLPASRSLLQASNTVGEFAQS